jgi:Flp pilus assembly protein TadD
MQEIEALQEQLQEYKEKINFFKTEQATIVDLEQRYSAKKKIDETQKEIDRLEEEINQKTSNSKEIIDVHDNAIDSKQTIAGVFNLKHEFSRKTSKEEIKNINNKSILLEKEVFGELFDTIISNKYAANHFNSVLFESIAFTEKLEAKTISDIYRVRGEEGSESIKVLKILIVSALTISVLKFKKIDREKFNLLNNFLNDQEDDIWERALVGICLGLRFHENRLEKFQINITAFSNIRMEQRLQSSAILIDQIMQNQLYKEIIEVMPFYEMPFLKEASNWFLPFTENNELLRNALLETTTDAEGEILKAFVLRLPMVDCIKFGLCQGLINGNINIAIEQKILKIQSFLFNLNINDIANSFSPYYEIIANIYLFDKYFSKEEASKIFKERHSIANTKLKNYLFSENVTRRLKGEDDFNNNKYASCIEKLLLYLKEEPTDFSAIAMIADSYSSLDDYTAAFEYLEKLRNVFSHDLQVKYKIAVCLSNLKKYEDAISYHLQIKLAQPKEKDNLFQLAQAYVEIEEFEEALKILHEIERNGEVELNFDELTLIGVCYERINNFDKAASYLDKAHLSDKESPLGYSNLAITKLRVGDKDEATILLKQAYLKEPKNLESTSQLALIAMGFDEILANSYFDKVKNNSAFSKRTKINLFRYYLKTHDNDNIYKIGKEIFKSQFVDYTFLWEYSDFLLQNEKVEEFFEVRKIIEDGQPGVKRKRKNYIDLGCVYLYLKQRKIGIDYFKKATLYFNDIDSIKLVFQDLIDGNNAENEVLSADLLNIQGEILEFFMNEKEMSI